MQGVEPADHDGSICKRDALLQELLNDQLDRIVMGTGQYLKEIKSAGVILEIKRGLKLVIRVEELFFMIHFLKRFSFNNLPALSTKPIHHLSVIYERPSMA